MERSRTSRFQALSEGKTIKFRHNENSMVPIIHSGQLVTVVPLTEQNVINVGVVVACCALAREATY
jgi:hypothetical protein